MGKIIWMIAVSALLLFTGSSSRGGMVDYILDSTPVNEKGYVAPKGELILFPLDAQTLVVAGSYNKFFQNRLQALYGKRFELVERALLKGKLKPWAQNFFYNFAVQELTSKYHPKLRDAFERAEHFRLNTSSAEPLSVASNGYWINAVGLMRVPRPGLPAEKIVQAGELVHFAYLRLNRPLENGEKLAVSTAAGEKAELLYDDEKTLSRAIKVNQVGYLPDAGMKYAYLGMWLGTLGELPVKQFEGKPFHVRNAADGRIVFSGKVRLRAPEQFVKRDGYQMKLNGETVMELDFSDFKQPGEYFIQVPGVGRSWTFEIGNNAVGRAFYVQMRGLFHQRSGIAKTRQYTQWNFDKPDHVGSWRGGFSPYERQYGTGKAGCITNSAGKKVKIRHFEVVADTKTEEKLPDVYGGWWDAGDFDRRTFHFAIVNDLLSVYQLFPEKFTDGQLDIPESGNGIPDIVDEAAWGVEVWRRAQNREGGVGCWLEATSHPWNHDPETDTQRYYLALPTRESTLEYCAHAARLARAYRACGQAALSEKFAESATRAWDYALNEKNRIVKKFRNKKLGELTYTEPDSLPEPLLFKAALNMFLLTGDKKYDAFLTDKAFNAALRFVGENLNPHFLSELLEEKQPYFMYSSRYRVFIRKKADEFLKSQNELAYRNINFPLKSPWFTFLGWGKALPLRWGAFQILAWQVTGQEKYRSSALLLSDWMLGANPMGRTFTTGLGKVYPVRLLSLPNNARGFVDPIPGITIYCFTGLIPYSAFSMIYSMEYKPRKDFRYPGVSEILLPRSLYADSRFNLKKMRDALYPFVPVWRRFANLESEAVDQNEFTVWETMGPVAAAYAALLPSGWKPPENWHKQKPAADINSLPGYIFLP